jgi:hypothetical protein
MSILPSILNYNQNNTKAPAFLMRGLCILLLIESLKCILFYLELQLDRIHQHLEQ